MKTISIPVNDRPHFLAKCLASIRACPTWREWKIVFCCEPPIKEATEQQLVTTPNAHICLNSTKLGCWANTFHAATVAMALGSELNLYLEDDYLITTDTLTMIDEWSKEKTEGVICLRRPHKEQKYEFPSVVEICRSGLFGCGFAWRSDMWPMIRMAWFEDCEVSPGHMWDISVAKALEFTDQWRPAVSRSFGIGIQGTHSVNGLDHNLFGPAYSGEPVNKFIFKA